MPDTEFPGWMDKTGFGVVGVVTLRDGAKMTAEVTGFDEELNELIVQVISPVRLHPEVDSEGDPLDVRIPCSRILNFEPRAGESPRWPHSDPCRASRFSVARFLLMTAIFLSMTAGSLALFILFLNTEPYRLEELSAISYTLMVVYFTFAAHNRSRRYLFTCPAVRPQLPRLLLLHVGFLLALFVLQTALMAARPGIPAWWNTKDQKGRVPFEQGVLLLCAALGLVQNFLNCKLLDRAHREYNAKVML